MLKKKKFSLQQWNPFAERNTRPTHKTEDFGACKESYCHCSVSRCCNLSVICAFKTTYYSKLGLEFMLTFGEVLFTHCIWVPGTQKNVMDGS